MTAFAIPIRRKRRSKPAQVAKGAAKVWTSMKITSLAGRTAKKTAKAYGSWRVTKFFGRRGAKVLLVPLAAGGGLAAWNRIRSSSSEPATPYGSPQGPAATSQSVSPPVQPKSSTVNGESPLNDPPAAASSPPVNPPPGATS